jgi:lipopolysaccharide/colanic/teichoic acid biosynthesis glycosyltransferase
MFRLDKIFQQDDYFFKIGTNFIKSFVVFLSIYIFSILEFNSIFDLLDYNIYKSSKYFYISLYFPFFYLLFLILLSKKKKRYLVVFLSFIFNDIVPLLIALPFTFYVFFIIKLNFYININTLYLFVLIILNLFLIRKSIDKFYSHLMHNNTIQRNIMLVGSVKAIEKILKEKKDEINIYKCCLIKSTNNSFLKDVRMNLKIPVFTDKSDMRIILEYHELGQIWILDNEEKNLVNYFLDLVVKFSVDIIIINLKDNIQNNLILLSDDLINHKYSYSNYQTSKFYGLGLFFKLIFDKIISILFLLLLFPISILTIIFIYIEDGFPIFFSEESAGWDGKRFNVFKFRIFKKDKFDQITKNNETNDKKYLKMGKFLKKLHIDEIPQFFNILKGEMSIVGPRPHDVKADLAYAKVFKKFLKRNKTAPGLTGWAQINGYRGGNPSNAHMTKRMEHDLWYMNNWNLWLDLYIIFKTLHILFKKPKK